MHLTQSVFKSIPTMASEGWWTSPEKSNSRDSTCKVLTRHLRLEVQSLVSSSEDCTWKAGVIFSSDSPQIQRGSLEIQMLRLPRMEDRHAKVHSTPGGPPYFSSSPHPTICSFRGAGGHLLEHQIQLTQPAKPRHSAWCPITCFM